MFCKICGKLIAENSLFCTFCGTPVADSAPAVQGEAQAAVAEPISEPAVAAVEPAPVITEPAVAAVEPAPAIAEAAAPVSEPAPAPAVSVPMQQGSAVTQSPAFEYSLEPPAPQPKEPKYYTLGHIIMCLAAVGVMAIVAGVFAGLYFSVI